AKDPAQRLEATELARELRAAVLQRTLAAPAPAPAAPAPAPAAVPVLQQAAAPAAERPGPAAEPVTRPGPVMVAPPPAGIPAAPSRLTVSTPPPVPPGAPEAAPGQAPPGPGRPRAAGPAIAGLVLAIISAAAAIVAMPLSRYSVPGKSDAFGYAAVIVPLVVAVIALARPGLRRPLLPYVLGAAFLSPAGLLWDVLAVPAYHPFSDNPWMPPRDGAHVKTWFALTTVGDIAGVVAVAILLIAVRRMSER